MAERPSGRTRVERGIYRQPNGKYAVCARRGGRLHFRTAGTNLEEVRHAREDLISALEAGRVPASPRLRLDTVAGRWSARFEAMVAAGERHQRTYEAHRFHLDHEILPRLGHRRIGSLGVEDVADLIRELRTAGRSPKTTANALATLHSLLRFARRRGWITADPVELLEPEERPRPPRHPRNRVLGRAEIERRVAPKTAASVREIPLVPQLAEHLAAHRQATPFATATDWVFATSRGTPFCERNVARRVLKRAADAAGLNDGERRSLRFHDLRHTFASHLIIDLGLDVAQVSRILGHASITITLDVYTHLFDDARHAREIRERMAASKFADLLDL
ncbi:MAG: tyrosine-type recombinase/integrase [Solirubrobacterales bacterium]